MRGSSRRVAGFRVGLFTIMVAAAWIAPAASAPLARAADPTSTPPAQHEPPATPTTDPTHREPVDPPVARVPASGTRTGTGGGAPRSTALSAIPTTTSSALTPWLNEPVWGDYVAAGTGLRNRGSGTISISGIPADATVQWAFLYWTILANAADSSFGQATLGGQPVAGSLIGSSGDPCWGNAYSLTYWANVGPVVTGNGDWDVAGIASAYVDGRDPWLSGTAAPMAEGASLVVIYRSPSSAGRRILINDGAQEVQNANSLYTEFTGFKSSSTPQVRTTFIGADGQTNYGDTASTFNGSWLPGVTWHGSDPIAGAPLAYGNLWDTQTAGVSSSVAGGSTYAWASVDAAYDSAGGYDCIVWDAQVLSVREPVLPSLAISTTSGPWYGQDSVTITGSGLAGATVWIGGRWAQVVESGSSYVTVIVPSLPHPEVDARKVDVVVDTANGIGRVKYTYRGAAVFLIRGLNSSLPAGSVSSWKKPDRDKDTFYQPNGLAGSLTLAGWPAATLLNFSYLGGAVTGKTWTPKAYTQLDSFPAFFRTVGTQLGSVSRLDGEVMAYLAAHPNIDIFLVGHSQGGVVALSYLAYLRMHGMVGGTLTSGTSVGHLAAVATLDSPIGGLDRDAAISTVCSGISLADSTLFDLLCSPLARLAADSFPDIEDFQTIKNHGSGEPWGSTRSVTALAGVLYSSTNQALATWASTQAANDVRVLTIGNQKDGTIALGTAWKSLSTQWLKDTAPRTFSRAIDSTTCGRFYDQRKYLPMCFGPDHNVVNVNFDTRMAVVDLFRGVDPGTVGMTVPAVSSSGAPAANDAVAADAAPVVGISGTVTGSAAPIAGAQVIAVPVGGSNSGSAETAVDGTYTLLVPDGTYRIGVVDTTGAHASGYWSDAGFAAVGSGSTSIVVDGASVNGIDVDLPMGRTLSGHVLDGSGNPVAGLSVMTETLGGEVTAEALTGDDGTWSAVVPSGSYLVRSLDPTGGLTDGYFSPGGTAPSPADAQTVTVDAADVPGIDLTATPVPPSAYMVALPGVTTSTSVAVSWGASEGGYPIDTFDVRYRRSDVLGVLGAYTAWQTSTATARATLAGTPGRTICFSVRVRDTNATTSPWSGETCTAVPLDDRSLTRRGAWTAKTGSAYYRSTYLLSKTDGAKLTRSSVVAKRISIVATTCSGCGRIRVYWNGKLIKTISLNATRTTNRRVLSVVTFTSVRKGTLTIKVYGSGRKVMIDGVALSTR